MSGLFGGGGNQGNAPTRYNSIQINRSDYGSPIPLIYGACRIPMTLYWYGAFTSTPVSNGGGKGGGSGQASSYNYNASFLAGLCEGPITNINNVWDDQTLTTIGAAGLTQSNGALGQATWSYLSTNFPTQAIPYDNTAWVGGQNFSLGASAAMSNFTFEVVALNADVTFGYDCEVYNVFTDYCTSGAHGCNFPYLAPMTGANSFQVYCKAMGFFVSPQEDQQRSASDFFAEMMKVTNCEMVTTPSVGVRFVPRADVAVTGNGVTYTPNLTPIYTFTDSDYITVAGRDPVEVERAPPDQTFNVLSVEYIDRVNQYNTAPAQHMDDGDIALKGMRTGPTETLHCIKVASIARKVAALLLQKQLYYLNQYTFRVRGDYCLLEPMDIIGLTDSGLNLFNTLGRIVSIEEDEQDEIEIVAEEMLVGPGSAPQYNWDAPTGYAANYGVSPGDVNAPYLFMGPPTLIGVSGGAELWCAVNGSNANWGGCYVFASYDGTTYEQVGVITAGARYGTLTAAYATGVDPDVTNYLELTTVGGGALLGGTQSDADDQRLAYVVDGEIVSSEYMTLVSAGIYGGTSTGLSGGTKYVRRGQSGSTIATHALGAQWARLDGHIFRLPIDPGMHGNTLYLKFCSYNVYGNAIEPLASATAYTHAINTPVGSVSNTGSATLIARGNCAVIGTTIFKSTTAASAWDSDTYSLEGFTNGCALSFIVPQGSHTYMMGLNTDPLTDQSYTSLDFAWYIAAGALSIYESGTSVVGGLGYAAFDHFSITYDGRIVRYMKNGVQIRAVAAAGKKFFLDSSFYGPSSMAQSVSFTGTANAQQTANYLSSAPWVIGATGTQGNYQDEATSTASSIVLGGTSAYPLGPYGQSEPLWLTNSGTSATFCGGWYNLNGAGANYDIQGIDPLKTYRSTVWAQYIGPAAGFVYHGCGTSNETTTVATGAITGNPYFTPGQALSTLTVGKWYLLVGFVHGSGFGTTGAGIGGIYDPSTGVLVSAGSEFKQTAGYTFQGQRVFQYASSNAATHMYFCRPRWEEVNGSEPSIATLLSPAGALAYLSNVDPTTGQVLAKGGVPPSVPDTAFAYTSAPTSVTITWSAIIVYRADGTTATITTGSQAVTGLVANQTYYHYPYAIDNGSGTLTMGFATGTNGVSGVSGSPAIAFNGIGTLSNLALLAAKAYQRDRIPLFRVTTVTPVSGTGGGGGGGGGGCPHPDQWIDAAHGRVRAGTLSVGDAVLTPGGEATIVRLNRPLVREWISVGFHNDERVTVTPTHWFAGPDGELVAAKDLKLGDILAGGGEHVEVASLRLIRKEARAVALELDAPHLYYLIQRGPLSHNPKP